MPLRSVTRMLRAASALALVALAACGSGGGGDGDNAPPAPPAIVAPPPPQENQFGANFGAAFRADPTSTPRDPADGDIVPLSFTTDPVNVG